MVQKADKRYKKQIQKKNKRYPTTLYKPPLVSEHSALEMLGAPNYLLSVFHLSHQHLGQQGPRKMTSKRVKNNWNMSVVKNKNKTNKFKPISFNHNKMCCFCKVHVGTFSGNGHFLSVLSKNLWLQGIKKMGSLRKVLATYSSFIYLAA